MSYVLTRLGKLLCHSSRAVKVLVPAALVMLTLAGCSVWQGPSATPSPSLPAPTSTKPPPPQGWPYRWLQGIPCRAPCWEGITPGKTTASEAVEILNRSPLVGVAQKKTTALTPELGSVSWDWVRGLHGSWANYPANSPAEIVYDINPNFPDYFRLKDVMQAYGEPSHVVVIAEHAPDNSYIYFTHWVIFLSQGLMLSAGGPPMSELDENTWFNKVTFFIPNEEGLKQSVWPAQQHPEWVLPWQGFRDYQFYCRDLVKGAWCRSGTK